MNKYRKIPKSCYNIFILLLILLALFLISKLIIGRKLPNAVDNKKHKAEVLGSSRGEKADGNPLMGAVQHVFPNKKIQRQHSRKTRGPKFSLKETGASFFTGIFRIDFDNPLTFVQVQFPAVAAHHDVLTANIPSNDDRQMEGDWSKEIYFVDYDGEGKPVMTDGDAGNRGSTDGDKSDNSQNIENDICEIDDRNVVDSLASISKTDLVNIPKPKPIKIKKNKPSVLIYHTHGTESYKPIDEGNYHSLKKEYTVIGVADTIAKELEKKSYNVIHDITYHDYPSYSGSYKRSADTVTSILKKNPSIKVILDVHRDGYEKINTRADRSKLIENSRIKINGEQVARFQFVIGATSKNRKEVECFARFVKAVSDKKYPGFSKEIMVKQYGSYNQYLSDYAALIELGSNANTIEEAKRAGYYLADVIADALKLLSE